MYSPGNLFIELDINAQLADSDGNHVPSQCVQFIVPARGVKVHHVIILKEPGHPPNCQVLYSGWNPDGEPEPDQGGELLRVGTAVTVGLGATPAPFTGQDLDGVADNIQLFRASAAVYENDPTVITFDVSVLVTPCVYCSTSPIPVVMGADYRVTPNA